MGNKRGCSEREKNFYIRKGLEIIEELYKEPKYDKKAIDKIKKRFKRCFYHIDALTTHTRQFIDDIRQYGKDGNKEQAIALWKDCIHDFIAELLKHNLIRPDAPTNEIENALGRAVYRAHQQLKEDRRSLHYDEDMLSVYEAVYRDEALEAIISSEDYILNPTFLNDLFQVCKDLRPALVKIQTEVNKGLRQIQNRKHFNEQILNHTMRSLDYVVVLKIDREIREVINQEFLERALQYARCREEEIFIKNWIVNLWGSPSMPLLINLFLAHNIPVDLWLIPIFALSILDAISLYVAQWEGHFRKFDIIKKQARRGLAKHQITSKLKKIQTEQRIQTNFMKQKIEPVLKLVGLSTKQLTTKHIKLFLASMFEIYRRQLKEYQAINISAYLADFLCIVLLRGWWLFPTLKKKLNLTYQPMRISLNVSDYIEVFSKPDSEVLDLRRIPTSKLSIKEIRKAIRNDKTIKTNFISLYP